ncbi:MAG: hypothetical protein QM724_11240 [Flavobacteriales bacterium]
MESTVPDTPWQRPRPLERLCIASFIDQGCSALVYFFGLFGARLVQGMSAGEVEALVTRYYAGLVPASEMGSILRYGELMRVHGVALVAVLLARTVARFIGTLRLWQGRFDGLHIYITAQLLGMLLPMLVAGRELFSFLGFLLVLNWCFLYWTQRAALR